LALDPSLFLTYEGPTSQVKQYYSPLGWSARNKNPTGRRVSAEQAGNIYGYYDTMFAGNKDYADEAFIAVMNQARDKEGNPLNIDW